MEVIGVSAVHKSIELDHNALSKYLADAAGRRSKLGEYDCVRFVIEALYAGWRVDYRNILGYQDRRTVIDRLRIAGGLEQAFTDELGPPVNPADLLPGDIAYFQDPAVGLVMPGYIAVKVRSTIGRVPLQFANKGWHAWVRS